MILNQTKEVWHQVILACWVYNAKLIFSGPNSTVSDTVVSIITLSALTPGTYFRLG